MSSQLGQQHKLHYVKERHVKSYWSDPQMHHPQIFHFEAIQLDEPQFQNPWLWGAGEQELNEKECPIHAPFIHNGVIVGVSSIGRLKAKYYIKKKLASCNMQILVHQGNSLKTIQCTDLNNLIDHTSFLLFPALDRSLFHVPCIFVYNTFNTCIYIDHDFFSNFIIEKLVFFSQKVSKSSQMYTRKTKEFQKFPPVFG